MTAKELIKILSALPEDQYLCFCLKDLHKAKKDIEANINTGNEDICLRLNGYERLNIGVEDDELFIINFDSKI